MTNEQGLQIGKYIIGNKISLINIEKQTNTEYILTFKPNTDSIYTYMVNTWDLSIEIKKNIITKAKYNINPIYRKTHKMRLSEKEKINLEELNKIYSS